MISGLRAGTVLDRAGMNGGRGMADLEVWEIIALVRAYALMQVLSTRSRKNENLSSLRTSRGAGMKHLIEYYRC